MNTRRCPAAGHRTQPEQDPDDSRRVPTSSTASNQPAHPLHALTTFELKDYRRELEHAIAFFDKQDPVPPARAGLQAALQDVLAEQEDRAKIAAAHA